MESAPRADIAGRRAHGLLQLAQRVGPPPLLRVDAAEVHEGELPRLVSRRLLRALEPRDRFLELVLLHEIDADVVVGVAEVRIDGDGAMAFLDRFLELALKAHRPAEE